MINLVDQRPLTVDERKRILNRALNAIPFLHYMAFPVVAGGESNPIYKTAVDINTDFYATELRGNFGELAVVTNTNWTLNVFEQFTGKSLYGFNRSQSMPAGMLTTECRYDTTVVTQIYDDRQFEWMPRKIGAGSTIIAEAQNVTTKDNPSEAGLAINGFQLLQHPYLNTETLRRINASLEYETVYQTFRVKVDHNGKKYYNVRNDNTPRLILAAGIVNDSDNKSQISKSSIQIEDTTRHLKLNNQPMPVEFFAPRLTCLLDIHQFWMPIEYYFEPFGNLRLRIENEYPVDTDYGYELILLTRTV